MGHHDNALVEAAAFQPGLQEAGRRDAGIDVKAPRQVSTNLVVARFPGPQPTLQFDANWPGITYATSSDIGERHRAAVIDEAAHAVRRNVRQPSYSWPFNLCPGLPPRSKPLI